MGWTSYPATHYKNGKIDRKAECDAYFMEGLNRGHFKVIKSSMVGSVYYAAVQNLRKCAGKDDKGEYIYEDIPESERRVWAAVFLTSTNMKDYYNFAYKDMDESCGPCECNCPKGILDLLSPTDEKWAIEWRKRCRDNLNNKNSLGKLPIGTKIRFKAPYDTRRYKKGDEVILTKAKRCSGKSSYWIDGYYYYNTNMFKDIYEVVKEA